jgi:hypothetical protein
MEMIFTIIIMKIIFTSALLYKVRVHLLRKK